MGDVGVVDGDVEEGCGVRKIHKLICYIRLLVKFTFYVCDYIGSSSNYLTAKGD